MTPESVNAYFTPLDNLLYLFVVLVVMTSWSQWKWANVCKHNVQVLVVRSDGHGDFELAPQSGGCVSLLNKEAGTARLWPINELSTIDVPYPGIGFIPAFMQKQIRMVVVDEKDWEPLINRGPCLSMVASPDVKERLTILRDATSDQGLARALDELIGDVATAPTREMIANPAVLGNLMVEKITEAVLTVNKEVIDSLSSVTRQLGKLVSPTQLYLVGGAILAVLLFLIWQVVPMIGEMAEQVDAMSKQIGIPSK